MAHAKKMVLIDPEVYEQTQKIKSTLPDTLSRLDEEMKSVLMNKQLSDHDKWTKYSQVLQRYLNAINVTRKPIALSVTDENKDTVDTMTTSLSENDILISVPKTFRSKAEFLLSRLKAASSVKWNEKGEISVDGVVIHGSNIIDLTNDILRYRQNIPDPTGWQSFARIMSNINMPFEVIGNWKRRAFIVGFTKTLQNNIEDVGTSKSNNSQKNRKRKTKYNTSPDEVKSSPELLFETPTATTQHREFENSKSKIKWSKRQY